MTLEKEIRILEELKIEAMCLEDLNQDNKQLLIDVDLLIALKQGEILPIPDVDSRRELLIDFFEYLYVEVGINIDFINRIEIIKKYLEDD